MNRIVGPAYYPLILIVLLALTLDKGGGISVGGSSSGRGKVTCDVAGLCVEREEVG